MEKNQARLQLNALTPPCDHTKLEWLHPIQILNIRGSCMKLNKNKLDLYKQKLN
jgi:hypothetical protein